MNTREWPEQAISPPFIATRVAHAYPKARITRHLWASAFRLGQGQCRRYSAGRWGLVGDAAHAMGPSAGAGMMVGLLGAWRLADALTVAGEADPRTAFAAYEAGQRAASRSVQRSNALIFRNIAVASPVLGATRNAAFAVLGRLPVFLGRLAAREAMIGLAPRSSAGTAAPSSPP